MDSEQQGAVPGHPLSHKNQVLNTVAGMTQAYEPIKNICGHLNAFHVYADEPSRAVEANHYCASLNEDVRQCLIYDSSEKNARLIGVEYMISPELYETLEPAERRLWHSHVFEIKSGMLIMPRPLLVPAAAWNIAEMKEMEEVIQLYGKIYNMWQVDRGDKLPIGEAKLMTSVTEEGEGLVPGLWEKVAERDRKFVADYKEKREARKEMVEPKIHPDADQCKKRP
ncbi:hypothetical protein GALMADRAFT_125665 [Galerina marginata CBS 339.88]|uniref:DUF1264 domain-containing protein n=1 Tax=Galerina marginata (strain CBS 339.88) TaxID=685588 RepID=A0A067SS25_GALM3|nr:hypothetical protein GALMADRAFT_125665 [Galerina marginata CBS 339.88]